MKQEDEELLLRNLCSRQPYGVKGRCEIDASYDTSFDTVYQLHKFDAILEGVKGDLLFVTPLIGDIDEQDYANEEVAEGIDILDFKPYLRPMSSMTEEEKVTWRLICSMSGHDMNEFDANAAINWLDSRHFDYRRKYDEKDKRWKTMIELGLALPAPEGMYKLKDM